MPLKYKIENVEESAIDELTNTLFYATKDKYHKVSLDSIRNFIKSYEEDSRRE
jgi:hypothetical protein